MLTDSRHARTKAASPSTRSVNSRVRSKQRSPGDSPCHKNSQCTHKQIQEHVETLYPLVCFSPCDSSVAPVTNLTWSNQQSNLAARMSPIFTCNKATLGSKTFIWLMFVQKHRTRMRLQIFHETESRQRIHTPTTKPPPLPTTTRGVHSILAVPNALKHWYEVRHLGI